MAPTPDTNEAGKVDLDRLHRARRDVAADMPPARLGGVDYPLPKTLPAAVIVGLAEVQAGRLGGLRDAIVALFGEDNVEAVLDAGFETADFNVILQAYNADLHFSSASAGSS